MGSHIILVKNISEETGSINPDLGFNYSLNLNDINEANIRISGTGPTKRSLLGLGTEIKIYEQNSLFGFGGGIGTGFYEEEETEEGETGGGKLPSVGIYGDDTGNADLVFFGFIDDINYLNGGGINFHASGWEKKLAFEKGDYSNSPYTSTASASIFSDIIGESSYFTQGTVDSGYTIDFRLSSSQSIWNSLTNLARKTQQDVIPDYINEEIDILNHTGSSTVVASFNDGINISNLRVNYALPKGNHIRVFGKGDGDDQITATTEDATSISTYGRITRDVIDRSIMSDVEASRLASAELSISKDPTKIYDFDVNNPNESVTLGDHIYLNSPDKDLSNEEVRIVGIEKGEYSGEKYLKLQVTNPELSQTVRSRNQVLSSFEKDNIDNTTYMQGSGNLSQWSGLINGNSTYGLKIPFYIGSYFEDESGEIRIKTLEVDYDIDEYLKTVGDATESNTAPSLSAGSTDSHKHDPSDTGHLHSVPTTTSNNTDILFGEGSDSDTSYTASGGSWDTNVLSEAFTSRSWSFLFARVTVIAQFSDGDFDVGIRVHNGSSYLVNRYNMSASTGISSNVIRETFIYPLFSSTSGTIYVDLYSSVAQRYNIYLTLYGETEQHSHTVSIGNANSNNSNVDDNNRTPGLAGNAASHNHSVIIGDGVSESETLNASSVNLYLEKWNTATSSWDSKHSVTSTGKTLDTNVDLTDSGTYPDSTGYWRVRITTNDSDADLIKGIVKIKHNLDN